MTLSEVLTRQVEQILPDRKGLETLMRKRKIRLYLGVDPTSPNLHLGHAVVLRKLRQFQDLAHEVILLFGTFTGLIGDPSGRDKAREPLSHREIAKNMAAYVRQAGKILDLPKTKIRKNGDWLSKLKPEEFLQLSSHFTVPQLLERDMFQNRVQKGGEVWVNELLYPLLQGYDSVAMDVDLEVGGTDQMFNMLIGRRLQKAYRNKEKFVLTVPLLLGLDGRKMSKSFGNTVNISDTPREMYGKLMSMKDEFIPHYAELCTELQVETLKKLAPRDAKAMLAQEIVTFFHGKDAARKAAEEFDRVFREKELPDNIPALRVKKELFTQGLVLTAALLVEAGMVKSKSEARRLIEQGGVYIDGERAGTGIQLKKGMILQAGKRRFKKIV